MEFKEIINSPGMWIASSIMIITIIVESAVFLNCVATVGFLQVEPNVMNIIPQSVTLVVDIRGVDEESIMAQYYSLLADLDKMSLGLTYEVENLLYAEPVLMDEEIKGHFEMSCITREFEYMHLPSGAGHDAQIFGAKLPAAMLFVPSAGGRSHCPEEKVRPRTLPKRCWLPMMLCKRCVSQ